MEAVYEDKYLNSVYYTDRCLGQFFTQVKKEGLWDNTLFILVADHGVVGPENAQFTDRKRFNIPMLWTGGALAVKDTVVSTYGGQTDIAATLLNQLDLDASSFTFSKNILDPDLDGFAFFDYPDAFGIINKNMQQVFDNQSNSFIKFSGEATKIDSLKAKAYMQMVSDDYKK
jgi:phosphoglycerol transferase MdoB-like AlkP superfamily enzyme